MWYVNIYCSTGDEKRKDPRRTFPEWIQSQGGTTCGIQKDRMINFEKDSDATIFVLRWGVK